MQKRNMLVCGIGINDADYNVRKGSRVSNKICPFYARWADMIKRCYSEKHKLKSPTYIGCSVCEEWLTFSNFKRWMETQDWQGKDLDKDLLVTGNKVYSPETCVFLDQEINKFTSARDSMRGKYPLGVWFHAINKRFIAECRSPFTGKRGHVGCFDCPEEAHRAWRKRKHELACQLADLQTDDRISNALRKRYA
jgi:hypothetical protein